MPCYFFAGVPIIKMLHTYTQGKNIETFSVLEKLSQLRFWLSFTRVIHKDRNSNSVENRSVS